MISPADLRPLAQAGRQAGSRRVGEATGAAREISGDILLVAALRTGGGGGGQWP